MHTPMAMCGYVTNVIPKGWSMSVCTKGEVLISLPYPPPHSTLSLPVKSELTSLKGKGTEGNRSHG